jgi:hypothetical protein
MRLGLLLGFLIGAALASGLARERGQLSDEASGLMGFLREQTEEARSAGREAAAEKEAEMLRQWEASRHGEWVAEGESKAG